MSSQRHDPPTLSDRWADVTVGDDECVVYDRENRQAWIQSTISIDAPDLR